MNPYWLEEPSPPRPETSSTAAPTSRSSAPGVTGCSAALRLAEAGLRVRVHDARGIAEGASGRNGGFALGGGAARYDVARETYGAERAAAYWRWTERGARPDGGARRATPWRVPAATASPPTRRSARSIRLEYEALREDGFEGSGSTTSPAARRGLFHGAISHPHDGSIQPARFVRRLAALAPAAGAELREHDTVDDVAALDADRVLVATDGYGHGLVPRARRPRSGRHGAR